jgi:hypothetical protein
VVQTSSRSRLFDPSSSEPYAVSRSKIELFLECPRCFYLDRRQGVSRPDGPPFSLNLAVDALMKKEFDFHRLRNEPHPVMNQNGIDAVPFRHINLETWRDTPTGIRSIHGSTNLEIFGIMDDVWQHPDGSLAVVDYKATSTPAVITLDERHGYKRQLEVYQWLLRRNGFTVSDTGYFVFVNGMRDKNMFDKVLEFSMQVLPYEGSDAWVEDTLTAIKECLTGDIAPPSVTDCRWCAYRKKAKTAEER